MNDAPERIWVSETPGQNFPYPEERRGAWTTNVGQYGNQVEYIRADLCRPEPQGWQQIETAPKDGTIVILLPWGAVEDLFVSFWMQSENRWANNEWSKITHWRPLPAPPAP